MAMAGGVVRDVVGARDTRGFDRAIQADPLGLRAEEARCEWRDQRSPQGEWVLPFALGRLGRPGQEMDLDGSGGDVGDCRRVRPLSADAFVHGGLVQQVLFLQEELAICRLGWLGDRVTYRSFLYPPNRAKWLGISIKTYKKTVLMHQNMYIA